MGVETSRFANICAQIEQIRVIFTHLRLWIAVAGHNLKWVKISINYLSRIRANLENVFHSCHKVFTAREWQVLFVYKKVNFQHLLVICPYYIMLYNC